MTDSQTIQNKLLAAFNSKTADYLPRTRHLLENGQPRFINRLILEDSPYLLQHAHNPVDWYSWGEEAFSAASAENKPVFLSIGYSTCHWCHVMEKQSFEDLSVADFLNQYFISIKVDREQYPDIDATYMTAVTLFSGQGGWPMSSFLTPQGKPFYGGTYYTQAGFLDLLSKINAAWHNQRKTLLTQAEKIADAVQDAASQKQPTVQLGTSISLAAINTALSSFDEHFGGFGPAPKFPQEPLLLLLLSALQRQPEQRLFKAVDQTLAAMAQGGIYDQVGGGFHRYSVDERWLVPHFEKMLYNQAYLARVYLEAYRLNHNPLHARIVTQTLDYVLREMRNTEGLFYSATDADSEGGEGRYFIWTMAEIKSLFPPEEAQFIIQLFGVNEHGNFAGKNILFLPHSLSKVGSRQQQSLQEILHRLDPLLKVMREFRQQKVPPITDNKVLLAWNGMIITALVEAGHFLKKTNYIQAAEQAAISLWQKQRPQQSVLWRVNLDGQVSVAAKQDDYAHFAEGLLALFDATANNLYLQQARQLIDEMLDKFLDHSSGALRMSNEKLLFTLPKDAYDGALPSGNSVAVRVLSRLGKRTGDKKFPDQAKKILQFYSADMHRQPLAYAYMLAQLNELNQGEIANYQYATVSNIKITSRMTQIDDLHYRLLIHFEMPDHWSLNNVPKVTILNKEFWTLKQIEYDLSGFELIVNLFKINSPVYYLLKLNLQFQSCCLNKCLPEETIYLYI